RAHSDQGVVTAMPQSEASEAAAQVAPLPRDALVLLPARQVVLFPGTILPLAVGRPRSIAAAQQAAREQRPLGVRLQLHPEVEDPTPEQLHRIGTTGEILRYVTAPDGTHHIVCRGVRRFRVLQFLPGHPFLAARVEEIGSAEVLTPDIEARVRLLRERAREAMQLLPGLPAELGAALDSLESASGLADFVGGLIDAKPGEKQELLETVDVKERLDKVLALLTQRIQILRLTKEIGEQTQQSLSSQQREHILREQLRQIQKELGGG